MCGKWYRGAVEAVDCFIARWHSDEADKSWLRHGRGRQHVYSRKTGDTSKRRGTDSRTDTAIELTNAEMKWQIVWQGTGSTNIMHNLCYAYPEKL